MESFTHHHVIPNMYELEIDILKNVGNQTILLYKGQWQMFDMPILKYK